MYFNTEAKHVDDEGKVVWIWYEMVLKENNKPKETELHLGQWARLTHDWMWPLRPNGGGTGGALWLDEVKSTPVASLLKHQFSILHLLLPPGDKAQTQQPPGQRMSFQTFLSALGRAKLPEKARDYPPGFLSSASGGICLIKREQC